jgi:hypothetical protein
MSFKNLNLNQQSLDTVLQNYPNLVNFTKDTKKQLTQYSIKTDTKTALLNVYFNKNGTTTISPNIGKEQ